MLLMFKTNSFLKCAKMHFILTWARCKYTFLGLAILEVNTDTLWMLVGLTVVCVVYPGWGNAVSSQNGAFPVLHQGGA